MKLKKVTTAAMRGAADIPFPSSVVGTGGITVTKAGSVYTIGLDNFSDMVEGFVGDDVAAAMAANFASPPPIGNVAASTGAFTTLSATALSASSTVSGTGFSTYLASPPAIGGTTPGVISASTMNIKGNTFVGIPASVTSPVICAYTSGNGPSIWDSQITFFSGAAGSVAQGAIAFDLNKINVNLTDEGRFAILMGSSSAHATGNGPNPALYVPVVEAYTPTAGDYQVL